MLGMLLGLAVLATPAVPSAPSALAQMEAEQMALFERMAPSVVFISTPDGFGSGFFVSDRGHVLTNRHVVGNRTQVQVVLHDGRRVTGTVAERGRDDIDVALVRVAAGKTPALRFAPSRAVRLGAWAASVGHGEGGAWTFNTGMVSNAHGSRRGIIQTQIPLNPGASGGPVFDRHGRVFGIVSSGVVGANAINFALTAELATEALPSLRPLCNCIEIKTAAGAPIFVDGTLVGQGPRAVLIAEPRSYRIEVQHRGKRQRQRVEFPQSRSVSFE